MSEKIFVVPHDFSPVGDAATKQALYMARQTSGSVYLLHIIKSDSEKANAETKIREIITKLDLKSDDPTVKGFVKKGNIFTDIGAMAETMKASMIVMGTHGAKGMQKVFGSYAIKVVMSCSVPFMVVQDKAPADKIEKIVLPVDVTIESLQIMNFAADLAKVFNSEVHLVAEAHTDTTLSRKARAHLEIVKKHLVKKDISCVINLLEGSGSYHSKVVDYGKKVNADIFAVAYHSESLLAGFDKFAQTIITNEAKIPALIVNSKQVSAFYF